MYETSYFADKKWFIPLAGFLAGGINGLLGAGGGIIVVFALTYALKGKEADAREVFANALCVMLPVSAVSCIIYAVKGNIITEGFGIYVIPAIIGGAAGAILLGVIKVNLLKKIFALLIIYSGIMMVIK